MIFFKKNLIIDLNLCLLQCLDEVQSYILVERSLECDDLAVDSMVEDCLHVVCSLLAFAFILFHLVSVKHLETSFLHLIMWLSFLIVVGLRTQEYFCYLLAFCKDMKLSWVCNPATAFQFLLIDHKCYFSQCDISLSYYISRSFLFVDSPLSWAFEMLYCFC